VKSLTSEEEEKKLPYHTTIQNHGDRLQHARALRTANINTCAVRILVFMWRMRRTQELFFWVQIFRKSFKISDDSDFVNMQTPERGCITVTLPS